MRRRFTRPLASLWLASLSLMPLWPLWPLWPGATARAESPVLPPAQSPSGGVSRVAIDMSGDSTGLHGGSFDASLTLAPFGSIDASGWRLRVLHNRSRYAYPADERRSRLVRGQSQETDLMVGYGLVVPGMSVVAMVGHAAARSEEDGVVGRTDGLRGTVSMFAAPTPRHMLYASVSHTAMSAYTQLLIKGGARVGPGLPYLGPELKGDWRNTDPWNQAPGAWRAGAHLSGIAVGGTSWSLSGGRLQDRALGVGGYLSLGAYTSF